MTTNTPTQLLEECKLFVWNVAHYCKLTEYNWPAAELVKKFDQLAHQDLQEVKASTLKDLRAEVARRQGVNPNLAVPYGNQFFAALDSDTAWRRKQADAVAKGSSEAGEVLTTQPEPAAGPCLKDPESAAKYLADSIAYRTPDGPGRLKQMRSLSALEVRAGVTEHAANLAFIASCYRPRHNDARTNFNTWCEKSGITSTRYRDEIWPTWESGFLAGQS